MPLNIIGLNDPALDVLQAALDARPDLDAKLIIIPWPDINGDADGRCSS